MAKLTPGHRQVFLIRVLTLTVGYDDPLYPGSIHNQIAGSSLAI